jgi:hypothetical protein
MSTSQTDIVIVSGLPRSGTSMMMRMLDAGGVDLLKDDLRSADEDSPKGYFEFEPVKDLGKSDDTSWLSKAEGRVVKIVSPLLQHLPREGYHYKVLFMRRHLREILASQAKMLERRGETHDTSGDDAMFHYFVKHIEEIQDYLGRNRCFETEYFFFREMLGDPLEQARRINEFLGIDKDVNQMASAVDSSLYRNRA